MKRVLRTRSNTVGKHLLVYHRRRRGDALIERDADAAIAQELHFGAETRPVAHHAKVGTSPRWAGRT